MKSPSILIQLAAGLFCTLPVWSAARTVQINVVVDFTPEGRKVAHPTPAAPAYYVPIASDFLELGPAVAGETAPVQDEVLHSVAIALGQQGYLLAHPHPNANAQGEIVYADGTMVLVPPNPHARVGSRLPPRLIPLTTEMLNAPDGPYSLKAAAAAPGAAGEGVSPIVRVLRSSDPKHGSVLAGLPSLILLIRYGYMNPDIVDVGGNGHHISFNQNFMLGLVGGNAVNHLVMDFQRERLLQAAEQDRYFVIVTAYDFNVYAATRRKVPLWEAKVSTPTHGIAKFSDVDAALANAGAGAFGRETSEPMIINLPQTPAGKVQVGPLTVKGVSEATNSEPAVQPQR